MRGRLPLPVSNKVSSSSSKSPVATAPASELEAASVTKKIGEVETEPPLVHQPPVASASKPSPAGMREEDSCDQFDDAEDDLPVAIPAPKGPLPQPPIKSNDAVGAPPPASTPRDSQVDAVSTSPNQEARRGGVKRPAKSSTPKINTIQLKRPPQQVDDYNHDPHCDADALETLAMACLQERKERPRIDKGERVEQDQVTRTDVLCGRGGMTNHHPGNVFYRRVVRLKQESYVVAAKRKKVEIATDIVHIIRCLNPAGRFLRKDDSDQNLWVEIGDKAAIAKTSQALREGAPDIRNLVVGNQSSGEASAPLSSSKGMEAPAISDRAKQILANVRKKHKDQTNEYESPARKGETMPQAHNKGAGGHGQQEKQSRSGRSPHTSPQQRATEGPEGSWEQQVAAQGHEGWGPNFSSAQAMAIQDSTLRGMQRMHQNGPPQRLAPPPYIAPPHMQLPPGHVAVLPPGCPIPPGFMLLAPAPQAQLIPVHQMAHAGGLGGRMLAGDPLARSLYSQYFVPHGHTPPELIGSAHLLNRLENFKRSQQMSELGHGHMNMSNHNEEAEEQGQDEEEDDEERDEHGQQISGSDDDEDEGAEAVEAPTKRSRLH